MTITIQPIWANWYGGSSYTPERMIEQFDSVADAAQAFRSRFYLGGKRPQRFHFKDGVKSVLTPAVDERTEMELYRNDPNLDTDAEPFLVFGIENGEFQGMPS